MPGLFNVSPTFFFHYLNIRMWVLSVENSGKPDVSETSQRGKGVSEGKREKQNQCRIISTKEINARTESKIKGSQAGRWSGSKQTGNLEQHRGNRAEGKLAAGQGKALACDRVLEHWDTTALHLGQGKVG